MSTPLIQAVSQHYKTKVDILGNNLTWDGSSAILKNKSYVNDISEKYSSTVLYDKTFLTYWGNYNLDIKYNSKELYYPFEPDYLNEHEIDNNMKLIRQFGYNEKTPDQYVCWQYNLKRNKTIGIHSGCFGGVWEKKKYPHFKELILLLLSAGYEINNFGNEDEQMIIDHINYHEFAGMLTLQETINKIAECKNFIANDSGLMHVADALNIPLIALFGPTLISKNRPVSISSNILTGNLDCQPCQYKSSFSSCSENKCLGKIKSGDIISFANNINFFGI
jgi:ADP-heptose:LPS heptosyltransferase